LIANQIGHYSLILGLFLSIIIIPISVKNYNQHTQIIDRRIFSISFFQFFFVLVSFFGLVISFINSDFGNETVYNNSHTTKPLFYKISGTWGNHEGSLLLWLLVLTFFIFLFLIKSKEEPKKYRILTVIFQQIIIIGFFLFVLKTSNPFNYLFPIPKEGLGLNPILQDPALAIHPPILYLGFVGTSIIFSSSLAAVVQKYISKGWVYHIKVWVLISWFFLTVGILLGSIWAYYELGWGGFWFWDPVENVSLMPWLTLTALLHCILVLEKKPVFTSWTIILSISTFILSVSGTFLVRSGILNSVHTFANDPERGLFILFFLFFLIFLSLTIFSIFNKNNSNEVIKFNLLSKETSILINNWFIMYFLSVVIIGTLYPIFLEVLINEKISIGPPFYIKLILPFLIPFLIFMSVVPYLKWIKSEFKRIKVELIFLFVSCLIISFLIYKHFGFESLIISILTPFIFYLFLITAKDFLSVKKNNISQKISHFGFSFLILSILLNSIFSSEIVINLKEGEKVRFKGGTIIFNSLEENNGKNYKSIIGNFEIKDNKNYSTKLEPELRIYNQPSIITSEADIKTTLFYDKFLVMNSVKNREYFNVRYQVKSFMIWIWIAALILAIGGIFSLKKKLYEK